MADTRISGLSTGTYAQFISGDAKIPFSYDPAGASGTYGMQGVGLLTGLDGRFQPVGTYITGSWGQLNGAFHPSGTVQPPAGWVADTNTWTYHSADDPSYVASVNANVSGTYSLGMKIRLTNDGSDKDFFLTKVTVTGSVTFMNLYGGTNYDLANAAITNPLYSRDKAPYGFDLNPDSWTLKNTSTVIQGKATPTNGTWYGYDGLSATGTAIDVPIGVWDASYEGNYEGQTTSGTSASVYCTLSTSSSSETDSEWTSYVQNLSNGLGNFSDYRAIAPLKKNNVLTLTAKTTYYLNIKTGNTAMNVIRIRGDVVPTLIKFRCAYL